MKTLRVFLLSLALITLTKNSQAQLPDRSLFFRYNSDRVVYTDSFSAVHYRYQAIQLTLLLARDQPVVYLYGLTRHQSLVLITTSYKYKQTFGKTTFYYYLAYEAFHAESLSLLGIGWREQVGFVSFVLFQGKEAYRFDPVERPPPSAL